MTELMGNQILTLGLTLLCIIGASLLVIFGDKSNNLALSIGGVSLGIIAIIIATFIGVKNGW